MPVRNILAIGLPDRLAARPAKPDVTVSHGSYRNSTFVALLAADDSIASTFVMARIPSHARISRQSEIYNQAIAGAVFTLGVAGSPACLVAATALAAAGIIRAASAIPAGNEAMPLWQIAGLLTDPKVEMDVIMTLTGASTAVGRVTLELTYVSD